MTVEQRQRMNECPACGHHPAASFDVGGAIHRVRACSVTHAASPQPIPFHHQRALTMLGHGSPLRAALTGHDDDYKKKKRQPPRRVRSLTKKVARKRATKLLQGCNLSIVLIWDDPNDHLRADGSIMC